MRLASHEVHWWCVDLDVPPDTVAGLYGTLTADERDRSAGLRFERERRRFVVARGALRHILSLYLGAPPGLLRFAYNAFGKPELTYEGGGRLQFNLSHSADLALVALAVDARIGIDLEQVRAQPEFADIARQFFSVSHADDASQPEAFLRLWTQQEAYGKASGRGLAEPLGNIPAGHWSLYPLEPAPGYVGALAVEGSGWRLSQRHWSPEGSAVMAR